MLRMVHIEQLNIFVYLCKAALCYISRDTPVEFKGWLCDNKTELEMLHLTGGAVHSCYDICELIMSLTGHSLQHNVELVIWEFIYGMVGLCWCCIIAA